MNGGQTYIELPYNSLWVNDRITEIHQYDWLYNWGMWIFLFVAAAVLIWVFYDSITKKKDQKALIPRILSMIGLFAIVPAFIFRFTGNIDSSHVLRLDDIETTMSINYNINWLVQGYGPIVAMIALAGLLLSIIAMVIYASSVQRSKPSTEFVQAFNSKMDSLENKVEDAKRNAAAANAAAASASASAAAAATPKPAASNATIIDRKPQAATIIDVPKTGDTLTVQAGDNRGNTYDLPANDVVIGRDAKCYIVLDDGKVSREHVKLSYTPSGWSALDMGSVNGTYINGARLAGQQHLVNGDTIKIGDTTLVFGAAR